MITYYVLKYQYYQYNNGSANNGFFEYNHNTNTLEEAFVLKKKISENLNNSEFAWEFALIDGYFTKYVGIFKVEQKKVD